MVPNNSTSLTMRVIGDPPFCFVWNARDPIPGFPFEAPVLQPETCLIPGPQKAHLTWWGARAWNLNGLENCGNAPFGRGSDREGRGSDRERCGLVGVCAAFRRGRSH